MTIILAFCKFPFCHLAPLLSNVLKFKLNASQLHNTNFSLLGHHFLNCPIYALSSLVAWLWSQRVRNNSEYEFFFQASVFSRNVYEIVMIKRGKIKIIFFLECECVKINQNFKILTFGEKVKLKKHKDINIIGFNQSQFQPNVCGATSLEC